MVSLFVVEFVVLWPAYAQLILLGCRCLRRLMVGLFGFPVFWAVVGRLGSVAVVVVLVALSGMGRPASRARAVRHPLAGGCGVLVLDLAARFPALPLSAFLAGPFVFRRPALSAAPLPTLPPFVVRGCCRPACDGLSPAFFVFRAHPPVCPSRASPFAPHPAFVCASLVGLLHCGICCAGWPYCAGVWPVAVVGLGVLVLGLSQWLGVLCSCLPAAVVGRAVVVLAPLSAFGHKLPKN